LRLKSTNCQVIAISGQGYNERVRSKEGRDLGSPVAAGGSHGIQPGRLSGTEAGVATLAGISSRGLRELRGWARGHTRSGSVELLRAHPRNSRNPRLTPPLSFTPRFTTRGRAFGDRDTSSDRESRKTRRTRDPGCEQWRRGTRPEHDRPSRSAGAQTPHGPSRASPAQS